MKLSFAFHIIGIVLWIGGLMISACLISALSEENNSAPKYPALAQGLKRVVFSYLIPGFVLTVCTGIYQLYLRGAALTMKQGWFHTKLTFILILILVTHLCAVGTMKTVRALQDGGAIPTRKKILVLHALTGLCFVVIVFVTLLR